MPIHLCSLFAALDELSDNRYCKSTEKHGNPINIFTDRENPDERQRFRRKKTASVGGLLGVYWLSLLLGVRLARVLIPCRMTWCALRNASQRLELLLRHLETLPRCFQSCSVFGCHFDTLLKNDIKKPLHKYRTADKMPNMNWKQLISDLQANGFTQVQIAQKCGCSQGTVSDIANGRTKEPGASIGLALVAMSKSKRKPTQQKALRSGVRQAA